MSILGGTVEDFERIKAHSLRSMERTADGSAVPALNTTGIQPTEFKVLILPDPVEEVTKGGIIVPINKAEADKYATIQGRIIAMSHLAFTYATAEEWGDAKPKPGDQVIFAKYAGVRHKAKDGQEYLLVNDKDIVATVEE